MTKLLVSVRDAAEARVAADAGVDLIDIKEPGRGSLGAATPDVVREIAGAIAGRIPLSVALGELADWDEASSALVSAVSASGGIRFAKLGLAGMGGNRDWETHWADAWRVVPADVGRVAVVYADWRAARAPSPTAVLQAAMQQGCKAVLVDTFDKRGGSLVDLWPFEKLAPWIDRVRQNGLMAVVAGSLTLESVGTVAALLPDYVAVRGAACRSGREGQVCPECIYKLRQGLVAGVPSFAPN
jgi:uncharacterized protein (UPF0264 family)